MRNEVIRVQLRNKIFAALETYNPALIKNLVIKDFERLEKLLNLDLPHTQLKFDYVRLDELSQTLVIEIPLEQQNSVVAYLESNFYQVTPIGGLSDPLMRVHALSQLMRPGVVFFHTGKILVFHSFGTRYRGYLDETPGKPGLHHDYGGMLCRNIGAENADVYVNSIDFSFADNPEIQGQMLALDPAWKRKMMEDHSFIASLPPTFYYDGDIVNVIDEKHENYSRDSQCLVFRTIWSREFPVYQVKLPNKETIELKAEQLALQTAGITRLFYNGSVPGRWKDLKSQAEFYLLLGFFRYHYNPTTDSYSWTKTHAKRVIEAGEGHGLLRWRGTNFLISFLVEDTSTFDPVEVAEATLSADLLLSL